MTSSADPSGISDLTLLRCTYAGLASNNNECDWTTTSRIELSKHVVENHNTCGDLTVSKVH